MFDALDVTTIDEDVSFYGPEQLVKDQPKVSTEKLPHLKARDGFRQPGMKVCVRVHQHHLSLKPHPLKGSEREGLAG